MQYTEGWHVEDENDVWNLFCSFYPELRDQVVSYMATDERAILVLLRNGLGVGMEFMHSSDAGDDPDWCDGCFAVLLPAHAVRAGKACEAPAAQGWHVENEQDVHKLFGDFFPELADEVDGYWPTDRRGMMVHLRSGLSIKFDFKRIFSRPEDPDWCDMYRALLIPAPEEGAGEDCGDCGDCAAS